MFAEGNFSCFNPATELSIIFEILRVLSEFIKNSYEACESILFSKISDFISQTFMKILKFLTMELLCLQVLQIKCIKTSYVIEK